MRNISNADVSAVFKGYPQQMREKLSKLRSVIVDAASELDVLKNLDESLKWGQPSYVVKGGSAVRLGLIGSDSDQYAMFFHCQTKLVSTFKQLFGNDFKYEGNRAIVFDKNDKMDTAALKHCVILALTYHSRKHLPMLGSD